MLMINQITYPHYIKYLEESKVDKFINMKEITREQAYNQIIDYLLKKIQDYLDEYNKNISTTSKLVPYQNNISEQHMNNTSNSSVSNILDFSSAKKSTEADKKSDSSTNSSDSDKITKDTQFLLTTVENEIGEMNYLV